MNNKAYNIYKEARNIADMAFNKAIDRRRSQSNRNTYWETNLGHRHVAKVMIIEVTQQYRDLVKEI